VIAVDGRLELIDLALLLIDALGRAVPLAGELLEPRKVLGCRNQLGLILGLLGDGLVERRLGRTRVDHGERITFTDLLAFLELNGLELAVDLASDRDRIGGLNGSQGLQEDRNVPRDGGRDCHRHGSWRPPTDLRARRRAPPEGSDKAQDGHKHEDCGDAPSGARRIAFRSCGGRLHWLYWFITPGRT